MQESEINILLKKYIDQKCSPAELSFVLNYIELPEGRRALEKLLLEDWNTFEATKASADAAGKWYGKLEAKGFKKTTGTIVFQRSWLKYAAIFMMITGIGFWYMAQHPTGNAEHLAMVNKYNPRGKRTQITLQDGSVVYLGADSRLKYPEHLKGSTREIFLEGEAFFEVKHDVKRPFIVHTGNVQTQVLGTSFKIEAFKNQKLAVAVATGKVSVGYKTGNEKLRSLAVLIPGRKLSWNPQINKSEIISLATEEVKGWKAGNLAFTDVRLDEISLELERWYNTSIIIKDPKARAYSLSININGNTPITLALDAITAATGLKYKIVHHQITLSK